MIVNLSQGQLKSFALSSISRVYGIISIILRLFIKIDNDAILFWSWNSRQYGCNPKALSDYILSLPNRNFKLYWSFKGSFPKSLDDNVIPLKWGSLKYLITALRCKFLISNTRNDIETMLFYKRRRQIYVMTWHAGMSLKKIEKDVADSFGKRYIRRSKFDSKMCNLMVSGSEFQTNLFKNSFWYNGEVLNSGSPRNDILFSSSNDKRISFCDLYNIDRSTVIVLFAPTFRSNFNPEIISFEWEIIKRAIEQKFHRNATLIIRLHPNIRNMITKLKFKFNNTDCFDVTSYPDMQELLTISDILITDYSSSMFDYSLMKKPCFLFIKDREKYDRGFYISLDELPFEQASNDEELAKSILNFNKKDYDKKIEEFNTFKVGSFERGKACQNLYNWIVSKKSNDC